MLCVVLVHPDVGGLLVRGAACPLSAGLRLVGRDDSLNLVIYTATNVSLANVKLAF